MLLTHTPLLQPMSLEPTQDAWNGVIPEQEQSIAWLLSRDIVDLQTHSDAKPTIYDYKDPIEQYNSKSEDDPLSVPMQTEEGDDDDDNFYRNLCAPPKIEVEAKTERKKNRILKSTKKNPKNPKALQELMNLEKEMRWKLTREEFHCKSDLNHHRRDDCEFWQLLERQRKRREDRVRRRILENDEPRILTIPVLVRPPNH